MARETKSAIWAMGMGVAPMMAGMVLEVIIAVAALLTLSPRRELDMVVVAWLNLIALMVEGVMLDGSVYGPSRA